MSFDYHTLDAPEAQSGNASDSDYLSELNSAKSKRGGQRSSSLPGPKVQNDAVSEILPMETIMAAKRLSFAEIDYLLKVRCTYENLPKYSKSCYLCCPSSKSHQIFAL